MNSKNSLVWRYRCRYLYIIIAIVGGLSYFHPSFAAGLNGIIDISYIPTAESIRDHIMWTKIIISSKSGEQTINIRDDTKSFCVRNVRQAESLIVAWAWKLPDGVSGDRVTHGLFPLAVTDISGTVGFSFYDLGTIHNRFVKNVEQQVERRDFSVADKQFELANDFYDKIRTLSGTKWPSQADSWNGALYQAGFNEAQQGGLRQIGENEKKRVRTWLKEWIMLCVKQQSLRSRLNGALQSWSKFSKLAYSRVTDWPDKVPQDMTAEEVDKVFLKAEFRDWMVEDMVWLQDEVFGHQSIRPILDGQPRLSALVRRGGGLGTSLSRFARAITDFPN